MGSAMRGPHILTWDNGAVSDPAATAPAASGPMRVTVHLLRHGLVENPDGVLYGRLPDFHLSTVGKAMAERVADHLAGADIGYLAASPLERAAETAAPLAGALDLPVVTDVRLIEPTNVFEGTRFSVGDGVLRRPRYWRQVRNPFTPSWGEPYLQIAHRMLAAVYSAVAVLTDGLAAGPGSARHEAVLVSHQLPIWTLRRYLQGQHLWHNPSRRQCGLASLTSLSFSDGVLTGLAYTEPAADLVPAAASGSTGA
jgi:broad specificity phosphatase PhoE